MNLLKKYYAELTGLFVFIIYLLTIAPSVVQIDSGELAAVINTLGIAHPTGYPLFAISGYLFSLVPLPVTNIFQANLLAAIWCTAGIIFFVKSVKLIFDNLPAKNSSSGNKKKSKKSKKVSAVYIELAENFKIIIAVVSGLLLAFSSTYWFQSTSIEVYSLHVFLMSIIIYFLLQAYFNIENKRSKHWFKLAIVLAFGFSNHMTTLLILPGIAYLFFTRKRFRKETFILLGKMLGIFFPILIAIYSYLPIRASFSPLLNWGNPINFENFMRHFSGKQYQVWLFSSMDSAKKQLTHFLTNLPNEFTIIGLVIIVIGFLFAIKRFRKISIFLLITFCFTIFYSINYDIVDIDSYFLLAYISAAFAASFFFYEFFQFLKNKELNNLYSGLILLTLPLIILILNFSKSDQSGNYIYEDYTKALMNSVEENSIIFSYQWDYFLSASYYYQFVENYRPDVAVIDKELLRRSWYYPQLETCYPGILKGIEIDVDIFLKAVQPFERSENFDPRLLETTFQRIMTGLVSENIKERNFYIAPEIVENEMRRREFKLPEGYRLVPELFLYRVSNSKEYEECPLPDYIFREVTVKDKYTKFMLSMSATMLANRAMYEQRFNKIDKAKIYMDKIRKDFPEYPIPPQLQHL